ncbi:class GN sortase [Kiloniella antarctica]|uniref:Class GN sortase n=1 Tax=Kiloniella antarctica TaxID=1550907 RepID=A0ABW5BQZ1_9PROT
MSFSLFHIKRGVIKRLLFIPLLVAGIILIGQGSYINIKAAVAQILLAKAWQETVETGLKSKAWPWADTFPVATIQIPGKSDGRVIALDGSSGEALAFAPGHLHNTAQPGQTGTAIYAAHRDTHFAFLEQTRKDDIIVITDRFGKTHKYQIDQMRIAPWDQSGINIHTGGKRIALVTCWPFGATTPGPLRYIVEGRYLGQNSITEAKLHRSF